MQFVTNFKKKAPTKALTVNSSSNMTQHVNRLPVAIAMRQSILRRGMDATITLSCSTIMQSNKRSMGWQEKKPQHHNVSRMIAEI